MFNYPNYSYNGYPYIQNYNMAQQQQQQASGNINWVQGEAGAKSFLVAPGQAVLLMDSENNVFYIKSTDGSGMPMPLRIFDYKERIAVTKNEAFSVQMADYVTREEFEKRLTEITNAEQHIPTTKQQQQQHSK